MPNTTNFNWPTPADTDLVKDGAAAIRNLGNGVDTSLVDLKGGTTGQILSKASNADMDFTFITPNVGDITEVQAGVGISVASGTGPIPIITNSSTDLITTAGDLLYGTAADTVARLGIGTAGQFLKVNSGATAPEWSAPAAAALVLTGSSNFTASSSVVISSCFSSTYDYYRMYLDLSAASGGTDWGISFKLRVGGVSASTNYTRIELEAITNAGSPTLRASTGLSSFPFSGGSTTNPTLTGAVVDFIDPGIARATKFFGNTRGANNAAATNFFILNSGTHTTATAYDALEIIPDSGVTITGTVRIYGFAKS